MNNADLSVTGANAKSIAPNDDVLKALRHLNERTSDSVIVESGKTSTGWWRKWSDGFIEQGGTEEAPGNPSTVSLPKSFSNNSYTLILTGFRGSSEDSYDQAFIYSKSASSFKSAGRNATARDWYACGY